MIKKVIHNIGPLHGRLTAIIPMEQFSLASTKEMLISRGCNYSDKAVVDTYMAFGGVAKYIDNLSCKKVLSENINALCFQDTGLMRYEYEELFASLFNNSKTHYSIMTKLSSKWSGWTQKELAKSVKISSGSMKKPLEELYTSGFISRTTKFGNVKKEVIYRATDCFSYFHNKWIIGASKNSDWNQISTTQSYKSWSGFAFENICHMHSEQIKKVLGINGVPTQTHYWSYREEGETGTQIDMMIEHTNGSKNIDIIECKYYNGKFIIDKKYKENLQQKINIFNEKTKHKYNIRLIMITSNGIEKNEHYGDVVNMDLELSDILSVGF
jgi:predicted transcriptional regulator